MSILLVAGSPFARSRSAALLDAVHQRLPAQVRAERVNVRELPAEALLAADASHRSLVEAIDAVARARAVVVATPVYKAAYSGILKVFLDVLPQAALQDKVVLPLATGGSPHHMLALDYALRPVLQSLSARLILPGVYATDAQVTLTPEGAHQLAPETGARLDEAVALLAQEAWPSRGATAAFAPVAFADVRCSV